MFHSIHRPGHTFAPDAVGQPAVREDTANLLLMQSVNVDLETTHPGPWLLHNDNVYRGEPGMMTVLGCAR